MDNPSSNPEEQPEVTDDSAALHRISDIRRTLSQMELSSTRSRYWMILPGSLMTALLVPYFGSLLLMPFVRSYPGQPAALSTTEMFGLLLVSYLLFVAIFYLISLKAYQRDNRFLPGNMRYPSQIGNQLSSWKLLQEGLASSGLGERLIHNRFNEPELQAELSSQIRWIANGLPDYTGQGSAAKVSRFNIYNMVQWPLVTAYISVMIWQLSLPTVLTFCLVQVFVLWQIELLNMRKRFLFYLPLLAEYLQPVLDFEESRLLGKADLEDTPREVQLREGGDGLRKAVAMVRNFIDMQNGFGNSRLPMEITMAIMIPLGFVSLIGLMPLAFPLGILVSLAILVLLYLAVTQLLPVSLASLRHRWIARRRQLIRQRGLLNQVAMCSLPLLDQHKSSPALQQVLLAGTTLAKTHQPIVQMCWSLMMNLGHYLEDPGARRRQWLARGLIFTVMMSLPLMMMIVPISFFMGFSSAGSGPNMSSIRSMLPLLLLIISPLQYWSISVLLKLNWDANAVMEELEELVLEVDDQSG